MVLKNLWAVELWAVKGGWDGERDDPGEWPFCSTVKLSLHILIINISWTWQEGGHLGKSHFVCLFVLHRQNLERISALIKYYQLKEFFYQNILSNIYQIFIKIYQIFIKNINIKYLSKNFIKILSTKRIKSHQLKEFFLWIFKTGKKGVSKINKYSHKAKTISNGSNGPKYHPHHCSDGNMKFTQLTEKSWPVSVTVWMETLALKALIQSTSWKECTHKTLHHPYNRL